MERQHYSYFLAGVLYGHVEATAAKRTHYFPLISNW